jgi:2-amino-4-hydroxy-6-hydroxymethyldihydropteridine diphosphokinase
MPAFCLSLGSSVGAREANLLAAIQGLEAAGLPPSRLSSVYETEPVGDAAGPGWFLNLAACGETELEPREILAIGAAVEESLGRERTVPAGPRTIDIDLLLLGERIVAEPGCEVPHPRLHLRRFVLEPLAEIAPEARHPILDLTVGEMLARLTDGSRVRRAGRIGVKEAV